MSGNIEHERFCVSVAICGARDLRAGVIRGGPGHRMGLGPNGWCQLPLGHVGPWHSQDPEGDGGYVLRVSPSERCFVPPGAAPVWR